jgi:hypothetical protein
VKDFVAVVAVIISVASYIPYLIGIRRRTNKPHAYSWLVWTIVTWIIFAAQISSGAGLAAVLFAVIGVFCLVIFILSIFYGEKNRTRRDLVLLILALLAVVAWVVTKNPTLSVILATLVDILAFGPTIRKCWRRPFEETITTHAMVGVSYGLTLLALSSYSFDTIFYPGVMTVMNSSFVGYILWRRHTQSVLLK